MLPTVYRTSTHGWTHLHLGFAASALSAGQAAVNENAALPSLHAAFTVLIAITLWPYAKRWARILLSLYPVAMGLTLVLTGEHYVVDLLLGYLYAVLVHLLWNHVEARRLEPPQTRSGSTSMRRRAAGLGTEVSAADNVA